MPGGDGECCQHGENKNPAENKLSVGLLVVTRYQPPPSLCTATTDYFSFRGDIKTLLIRGLFNLFYFCPSFFHRPSHPPESTGNCFNYSPLRRSPVRVSGRRRSSGSRQFIATFCSGLQRCQPLIRENVQLG